MATLPIPFPTRSGRPHKKIDAKKMGSVAWVACQTNIAVNFEQVFHSTR